MADIEYWRANYSDNIDELEQLVSPLKSGVMAESLRTDERTELIQSAEDKLKRVAQVKKSFSLEMRMLRDRTARADYERTMEALDKRVAELESEVRNAKAEGDRERLLAGGGSDGGARGKGEGKTNDDYLKAAHGIQDKTVASVDHTLQMIEQSRDVGQATLEELQRQREQIDEVRTGRGRGRRGRERAGGGGGGRAALCRHAAARIADREGGCHWSLQRRGAYVCGRAVGVAARCVVVLARPLLGWVRSRSIVAPRIVAFRFGLARTMTTANCGGGAGGGRAGLVVLWVRVGGLLRSTTR